MVFEQKDQSLMRRYFTESLHNPGNQNFVLQNRFQIRRLEKRTRSCLRRLEICQQVTAKQSASLVIQKTVDSDSSQPGVEARVTSESRECLKSLQLGFLRKILGIGGRVTVMQRQRVDAPLVSLGELAKGDCVTRLSLPD